MSDRSASLAGCLLGQALGDALGFVVEAEPPDVARRYVADYLRAGRAGDLAHPSYPFGQYSDDTQLARELVLSFADTGRWSPEAFARRVAALFAQGRDVGAGPGSRAAAARLRDGAHWSVAGTPAPYAGNGSAMRAGPLGVLFAEDEAGLVATAVEQSLVTHRDPRCAAGAVAVAAAVALAARPGAVESRDFLAAVALLATPVDGSVADAILRLTEWTHLPPSEASRRMQEAGLDPGSSDQWRGVSSLVTPSVVWSLYAFLQAPDDYWTAVCTAIEAGGDTDTMAAMTGAIAGARSGTESLPRTLLGRITDRGEWGTGRLAELADRTMRLVAG